MNEILNCNCSSAGRTTTIHGQQYTGLLRKSTVTMKTCEDSRISSGAARNIYVVFHSTRSSYKLSWILRKKYKTSNLRIT